MSDETTMQDAPAVDDAAPVAEAEEAESEVTQDQPEAEEAEGEGEAQPEEEVEFKFGRETIRLPKAAIPDDLRERVQEFVNNAEASTTRKSQELAEQRKSLETGQKTVEKLRQLSGEALATYSRGLAVKAELDQLGQIDLNAMWQSNPDQARRVSDAISQRQAEFTRIVNRVNQLEGEAAQTQTAEQARLREEGKAAIAKHIPEFEQKVLPDLSAYMVQQGFPKEGIDDWALNPILTINAHKAMLYDRMQAQAKSAAKPKPVAAPAQPIKPIAAKGGTTATKDVSKMTPFEMAKHLGLPG